MIPPLLAAILPCREPGGLPGARLGWPHLSITHRHAGVPSAGGDPHIPLALPMAAHLQQHIWVQDTSGEPQPRHPLPGHPLPPQHQPLDLGCCGTRQPPWHRAPCGVGPRGAPPAAAAWAAVQARWHCRCPWLTRPR